MTRYYDKPGNLIGIGDAIDTCAMADEHRDHDPHAWNWARFGETDKMMCPGYPTQKIYDTPKRRPVYK